MADEGTTIIIKKIKKGGHGAHGGAWKVAYADFVTAMMAFFLLLWLLNATSDEAKSGIADYFAPTRGIKDAKGIGFTGGETPYEEGNEKSDTTPVGIVYGGIPSGPSSETENTNKNILKGGEEGEVIETEADKQVFDQAAETIKRAFEENPNLQQFRDYIILEQTPEGLKITISEMYENPMFQPGSAELSRAGKEVLTVLSEIIRALPKRISITGHTDSSPLNKPNYSNWELSTDRANSTRRFMLAQKVEDEQVAKVIGRAAQEPLANIDPTDPKNRRIVIILLREALLSITEAYKPAARNLLSVPRVDTKPEDTPKTPETITPTQEDGLTEEDKGWAQDITNEQDRNERKQGIDPADTRQHNAPLITPASPSLFAPAPKVNAETALKNQGKPKAGSKESPLSPEMPSLFSAPVRKNTQPSPTTESASPEE